MLNVLSLTTQMTVKEVQSTVAFDQQLWPKLAQIMQRDEFTQCFIQQYGCMALNDSNHALGTWCAKVPVPYKAQANEQQMRVKICCLLQNANDVSTWHLLGGFRHGSYQCHGQHHCHES